MSRIDLTGPATIYCRNSTGSDTTGDGSAGNPYKTLQHVINLLMFDYDLKGHQVVIETSNPLGQEIYDGIILQGPWVGSLGGASQVTIKGGLYSNSVVIRPAPGANCPPVAMNNGAKLAIEGVCFDCVNVPGWDALSVTTGAWLDLIGARWENIGSPATAVANCIVCDSHGYVRIRPGTYWMAGAFTAQALFFATNYGVIYAETNGVPGLVTINHTAAQTTQVGYAAVFNGTVSLEAVTFLGATPIGRRFFGDTAGFFDTLSGGNLNYFPGTLPGVKGPLVAYR